VGTVFITGVAGFIGSSLADRLLADGHAVVGIDSFEDYYARSMKEANLANACRHPRFCLIEGNLLDLALDGDKSVQYLRTAIEESDFVFHLAAQAGVRASWGSSFRVYAENNVLATQLLLEATKNTNAQRVIYASSSSVYGDSPQLPLREDGECRPLSPYGVTKLAGEHLCNLYLANFHVPTVSLRFFTVYGPRQRPDMGFHRFIRAQMSGGPITVFGDGRQTRDFTYIDDIVDGLVAAMGGPVGMTFNLGGGSRISLLAALRALEEATGLPVMLRTQAAEAGDVRHTWADTSLAREKLGFQPKTKLTDGLRREYQWLAAVGLEGARPRRP
jgi:UDP-glucose 4-epimerase